jgi:hypothetical protein
MVLGLAQLAKVLLGQFGVVLADAHAQVVLPRLALVAADHGPAFFVGGRAAHAPDDAVVVVIAG